MPPNISPPTLALALRGIILVMAQTELSIDDGFEPVISADRSTGTGKRVQIVYMGDATTYSEYSIRRTYSPDQGGSWVTPVIFAGDSEDVANTRDPVACCNIADGNTPPCMYFGWLQDGTLSGVSQPYYLISQSDNNVNSSGGVLIEAAEWDRPWLACNADTFYLAHNNTGTGAQVRVTSAPMVAESDPIAWPSSSVGVATADSNCAFIGNFPIAAQVDSDGNDVAYVLGRQYYTGAGSPPLTTDNSVKVWRSSNGGGWTNPLIENNDSAIGFGYDRDGPMVPFHICCDLNSSRVYAFFAKNETSPYPSPTTRDVLLCMASDGGTSWTGPNTVYTLPSASLPANFAVVPANSGIGTIPGFYRIGRVWSCVDPGGNIFVCWMDNRYGRYGTTDKDYWHVFYSKSTDHGSTWSTPVRVSDPGDMTNVLANASIGGGIR